MDRERESRRCDSGKGQEWAGQSRGRSAASIVDLQDVNEAKEELSLRCINEEEKSSGRGRDEGRCWEIIY